MEAAAAAADGVGGARGALSNAAVDVCDDRVERRRDAGERDEAGMAGTGVAPAAAAAAATDFGGSIGTANSPSTLS